MNEASRSAGPIRVTLWGPSSAGKTMLLAQLSNLVEQQGWYIRPETDDARVFMQTTRHCIEVENRFPMATVVGSRSDVRYYFENRGEDRKASLHIEDRSGMDYEDFAAGTGAVAGPGDTLREFEPGSDPGPPVAGLRQADGVVLLFDLFDPRRESARLRHLILSTLERLVIDGGGGGASRDPRPFAVCLTKADLKVRTAKDLADAKSDAGHEFARTRIGEGLRSSLDRYCANYRLFPVSAAGASTRWGVVERYFFYDEQLKPRLRSQGVPLNLIEPFLWLFDEIAKRKSEAADE